MTLPAPGNSISANQINVEAERSGTSNAPLSGSSSTPQAGSLVKIYSSPNSDVNQVAPHKYSEFYSKTFTPTGTAFQMTNVTQGVGSFNPAQVCKEISDYGGFYTTFYHNGSGALPVAGDNIYTDEDLDNPYVPSEFVEAAKGGGDPVTSTYYFNAGSSQVAKVEICESLSYFPSSNLGTVTNVCQKSVPTFPPYNNVHNGTNFLPIAGDLVYAGTTLSYLASGYYKTSTSTYILVGANGIVSSVGPCNP
tara:strand:+ start:154 stop:903 length:750 start_codon:yes stop_codon:yes gene_type:complete